MSLFTLLYLTMNKAMIQPLKCSLEITGHTNAQGYGMGTSVVQLEHRLRNEADLRSDL